MAKGLRGIPFPFPIKGLDKKWALRDQPLLTSPDLLNVRSFDAIGVRTRGGQRCGLRKRYFARIGLSYTDTAIITNPGFEAGVPDIPPGNGGNGNGDTPGTYACLYCTNRGEQTPAFWDATIAGCTGIFAVMNGQWHLVQGAVLASACWWGSDEAAPYRVTAQMLDMTRLEVRGFPIPGNGSYCAVWRKLDGGCIYDGQVPYYAVEGGAQEGPVINSTVIIASSVSS